MTFKRFLRAIADLVTSKKAIGAFSTAAAGVVAPKLGLDTTQTAFVISAGIAYVLAQAHADRGKEQAKKQEQFLRERLVAAGLARVDKDGNLIHLAPEAVAATTLK